MIYCRKWNSNPRPHVALSTWQFHNAYSTCLTSITIWTPLLNNWSSLWCEQFKAVQTTGSNCTIQSHPCTRSIGVSNTVLRALNNVRYDMPLVTWKKELRNAAQYIWVHTRSIQDKRIDGTWWDIAKIWRLNTCSSKLRDTHGVWRSYVQTNSFHYCTCSKKLLL